jgi:SEC-C motif-containing protein
VKKNIEQPTSNPSLCPCGSQESYANCCEPLHKGEAAPSAEALMRSRYSAYVLGLSDYLQKSWHSSKRPSRVRLFDHQWIGLKIVSTEAGQTDDNNDIVEFIAKYKQNGKAFRLHERSRFIKEKGHWFYVDGDIQ